MRNARIPWTYRLLNACKLIIPNCDWSFRMAGAASVTLYRESNYRFLYPSVVIWRNYFIDLLRNEAQRILLFLLIGSLDFYYSATTPRILPTYDEEASPHPTGSDHTNPPEDSLSKLFRFTVILTIQQMGTHRNAWADWLNKLLRYDVTPPYSTTNGDTHNRISRSPT